MLTAPAERLAEIFVEIADTLVDEFDLMDFMQMVTARAAELFDTSAAGLMLVDNRGRLQLMAASDEQAKMLELFQVQADEGPCQDCFNQGVPVINADLTSAADRWPNFAPRAVEAGFRSVHAFPLRLRDKVIGALNMFGAEQGQMEPKAAQIVQALADITTIGLLQERAIRRGEVLTEQLQAALNSRIVIEQAKGALAQLRGVSPDEGFELLRDYSRNNGLPLSEVARGLVVDPAQYPGLSRG